MTTQTKPNFITALDDPPPSKKELIRHESRNLLRRYLVAHPEWNRCDEEFRKNTIRRIEQGCMNAAVIECKEDGIVRTWSNRQFVDRYSMKLNKVLVLIDVEQNKYAANVVRRIISGDIPADEMSMRTADELCPEANQKTRDEIELRKKQKVKIKVSTTHRCRKCGNNKTVRLEQQSNALDEASKFSIKCVKCEHVWRI